MADKNIGVLPQVPQLMDDSLMVVEQQGQAMKMTGRQFREFGKQAVMAEVQELVDAAETAAESAVGAVKAVTDMTVEAEALETGQEAAVVKSIKNGVVNLAFVRRLDKEASQVEMDGGAFIPVPRAAFAGLRNSLEAYQSRLVDE